jgi:hypothetical protein
VVICSNEVKGTWKWRQHTFELLLEPCIIFRGGPRYCYFLIIYKILLLFIFHGWGCLTHSKSQLLLKDWTLWHLVDLLVLGICPSQSIFLHISTYHTKMKFFAPLPHICYVFMAWYLVKCRDNFTLHMTLIPVHNMWSNCTWKVTQSTSLKQVEKFRFKQILCVCVSVHRCVVTRE